MPVTPRASLDDTPRGTVLAVFAGGDPTPNPRRATMLGSLHDLPLWITGSGIIAVSCVYSLAGLLLVRRHLLPRLRVRAEDAEFGGSMVQAVMGFYGLAMALISVSVWQSYSDASRTVSEESAHLAALYRDASLYPEPARSTMQTNIRIYVDFLVRELWPLQRQGAAPPKPPEQVGRLLRALMNFEPASDGQKAMHAETLRALNETIKATRMRQEAARGGLPPILWTVIVLGAAIGLCASFFFKVEDVRLHGILVVLLAAFVGLIIFMVFALDRPFRGDLGLGPGPYELVYRQLMEP